MRTQRQPRRRRPEVLMLASTLAVVGAVGPRPAAAFLPPSSSSSLPFPLARGRAVGAAPAAPAAPAVAAPCKITTGVAGMDGSSSRRRGAELLRVGSATIDRTTAESEVRSHHEWWMGLFLGPGVLRRPVWHRDSLSIVLLFSFSSAHCASSAWAAAARRTPWTWWRRILKPFTTGAYIYVVSLMGPI